MKVTKQSDTANGFCGPAALSIITGRSVEECVASLRAVNQEHRGAWAKICGVRTLEMEATLRSMGWDTSEPPGFKVMWNDANQWPTLRQWLRATRSIRKPDDVILVATTGHFIVIRGRKYWDNIHPEGAKLSDYGARNRLHGVLLCTPQRDERMGKHVRFYSDGWRVGVLSKVEHGKATIEGIAKNYTVPVGDVREVV